MLDSVDIKWREMFTYTCFSHKTFKLLTLEYFCIKLKFKDNSTSFSEYILQVKYKLLVTKFKWNMNYKLHVTESNVFAEKIPGDLFSVVRLGQV